MTKAVSIALLSSALWMAWGILLLLVFVLAWYSYAPYALGSWCDFSREANIRANDELFAGLPPLPASSGIVAVDVHSYGNGQYELVFPATLPGGKGWQGNVYHTTSWYIRLEPDTAPADALQWYADNLAAANPNWQPAHGAVESIPGLTFAPPDNPDYPGIRRTVPAPSPMPGAPWQFLVFRNDKAGLSVEQGKSQTWRPGLWPAPGEDRRTGRYWLGGIDGTDPVINPNALENLPDADRDVIVSINFRAYHPPGMFWCPKLGY